MNRPYLKFALVLIMLALLPTVRANGLAQSVISYNTLKELLNDKSLTEGILCQTTGYYTAFDGGGATYKILRKQPSTYSEITEKGLYAKLVSDKHNIRCYGATEGKDCSQAIQKAIDANKGGYIIIPEGNFMVGQTLGVNKGSLSILGMGDVSILYIEKDIKLLDYSNNATERLTIRDVCFEGKGRGKGTALQLGKNNLCLNTLIENCVFRDFYCAISLMKEVDNITIRNCYFLFNTNGVFCSDISMNKSSVRIYDNHFQMQREGGYSVYLEVGSSVEVSNNLFQTSNRNNVTFIKLYSLNQVGVSNNYLELSKSTDPVNNIGIDVNNLSGARISHTRAQGYMHSVVRVNNSFSTEIDYIVYSPLGYSIPAIIENIPTKRSKKIKLDLPKQSINLPTSKWKYIDNLDGVQFAPSVESSK